MVRLATLVLLLGAASCKKDKKTDDPGSSNPGGSSSNKKYALVIDNGAQSLETGQTLHLSAHLVSSTGEVITPSGITWSSDLGGISGSNFSVASVTVGVISASVQYDGGTYTASVPVSVYGADQLFGVVPSAIIWSNKAAPIQLTPVYMGGSATYAYASDNSDIASVSSTGLVTFNSVGTTNIKVTATINGQPSTVIVPVMVVGVPDAPLPVTRVEVSPALGELFRGETLQLNAKAYNSNGDDVSSTVSFNYAVVPKLEEDQEPAVAASVSGSGLVKALTIGGAYITVTANGVMGQAEIVVNPDTVIVISPFYVNLGGQDFTQFPPVPNPTSAVLTASTKKVDRTKYRAKDPNFLVSITNSSNLVWQLPTTGIPQIDDQFKVVTLENATNTSVTVKAIPGKSGSTMVIAQDGIYGGAAPVLVNP